MLYFEPSRHATALGQRVLLGELLIQKGLTTREQITAALKEQESTDEYLGAILVRRGWLTESQLLETLGEQLGMPYVRLANRPIEPELVERIPARLAHQYRFVPVSAEGNQLQIAIVDPFDTQSVDELRQLLNCEIRPLLAVPQDILGAIERYYGPKPS